MIDLPTVVRLGSLYSLVIVAGSASAQDVPEQGQGNAEEEERIEEIIITGSQIRGADVTGMLSVTVFGADEIASIEATATNQIFEHIPQAMAEIEYGDETNTETGFLNGARGDVYALNLRHIGPDNTLQLINGRRLVRHPGSQFSGGVPIAPVNTAAIPARGVRRVEILRDGGAAIYGADAVAGVANTILRRRYDGLYADYVHGASEETSLQRNTVNILGGKNFNNGRTNITLSLHYTDRNGFMATDRERSASSDLRPFYIGTPFEGDTQLDNRGTFSAWGQFVVVDPANDFSRVRVRDTSGNTITNGRGTFHIQPIDYQPGGCRGGSENDANLGTCIDDGGRHRDHYYDRNPERTVQNDVERFNSYLFLNHELKNGIEFFAEAGFYRAESHRQAEQAFFVGSGPLTMSPDAYWNPFGERLSGNPNRLQAADVPDEGYAVNFAAYRLTDLGPATADIENRTYRGVFGFRGTRGDWDWETAYVYSESETLDIARNWASSTLFMEALNRTDELAYNPFNGGCVDAPTLADTCTPGTTEEVMDSFRIDVYRNNETDLSLADFKLSNPSLFRNWAGDVGVALGVEWRNEGFAEDRDPRLDGTITYTNDVNPTVNGEGIGDTDVLGLSTTPDGSGSVDVLSAFVEFAIPLSEHINVQYAGRYEDHELSGNIYRNKLAASWDIGDFLRLRGSYAEGFKSPSLATLFTPALIRNGSGTDNYRCYAYGLLGDDATVQALYDSGQLTSDETLSLALSQNDVTCDDGQGSFPAPRLGGPDLKPETSEQVSVGFVIAPPAIEGLTLTVDYWEIEQFDVFNRFTNNENLSLDFALRLQNGESNPAVLRDTPTPTDIELYTLAGLPIVGRVQQVSNYYTNLERRVTRGLDVYTSYRWSTGIGDFSVQLRAFKLLERVTSEPEILEIVNDLGYPDLQTADAIDTVGRDGRPEWRGSALVSWHTDNWRALASSRCVSSHEDTSVSSGEIFLNVPGGCTINANIRKTFRSGWADGLHITVGARNIFNKDPAENDSLFGVSSLYSGLVGRYWYTTIAKRFF